MMVVLDNLFDFFNVLYVLLRLHSVEKQAPFQRYHRQLNVWSVGEAFLHVPSQSLRHEHEERDSVLA